MSEIKKPSDFMQFYLILSSIFTKNLIKKSPKVRSNNKPETVFLLGCFVEELTYNERLGGFCFRIHHDYSGFQPVMLYFESKEDLDSWKAKIQPATRTADIASEYEIGN